MDLPNLKDLKAILKLCRAQGVTDITLGALAVKFGDMPYEIKGGERVAVEEEQVGPTDEELAMWSAAPDPLVARLGETQ
jgi:hypothetical protein